MRSMRTALVRSPTWRALFVLVLLLAAGGAVIPLSKGQASVADAITAVAAAAALLGAAASVLDSRRLARQERAYAYAARQDDPALLQYSIRAGKFLNLDSPPASLVREDWERLPTRERARIESVWKTLGVDQRKELKWRQWELMAPEDKISTMVFLNLLEEVGSAYNLGLLYRPSTKLSFASVSDLYWQRGRWFVVRLRVESKNKRFFREWQRMNDDLPSVKV